MDGDKVFGVLLHKKVKNVAELSCTSHLRKNKRLASPIEANESCERNES